MNRLPEKIDLKNLSVSELKQLITSFGKERYRTTQILRWLYQKGAESFDEMSNLSKKFLKELAVTCVISSLSPTKVEQSSDGTKKFLFQLDDGCQIESVLIPDKERLTLCISTQAGCAMGCRFCLTGKKGLTRDLRASEILNQVVAARRTLPAGKSITNVVLMGMGEPLANYDNTLKAIELLINPDALKFSSRRVTLSTVGLLPELERLGRQKPSFRLAISLNAPDEEIRSRIMPISRRYPLKKILELCRTFPLRPRTRITFEYVLMEGINDSHENAKELLRILRGIPAKVNLIPLNEAPGIPYRRPSEERVREFQEILMRGGLAAIVRTSKGADISAACGQLQGRS